MRSRLLLVLVVLLAFAACAAEPEPEPVPEPEATPTDDAAAIDALRAAYVEHYNLGHAETVAGMFTDEAVSLFADGSVNTGRDAILGGLQEAIAANPTVTIEASDTMIMGDRAVSRGVYTLSMAPEGAEPMSFGGHYMTGFEKIAGEWKIGLVISNYDAPPAEGLPVASPPATAPEDLQDSPTAALTASYAEHFNMGHPSVVAELYDDDAVASFADQPVAEGREAIEAALTARIAEGSPQLTIHEVGSNDLGEGWYVIGGWYEIVATTDGGEMHRAGSWVSLVGTAEDGSQRIRWALTNARHDGM